MDRFKVSGQDLIEFYSADTLLSQVFGDIELDLRAQNRVVCQYILNGLNLSEADEGKFAKTMLKDVKTLEYVAENKSKLVEQVLIAWQQAIPEMMLASEKLCQRMRFQGAKGIFKDIHDLVENVECLISSLMALKEMAGAEICTAIDGWVTAEDNSKKTVFEALHAHENNDFVLLADILEYDLNTVLQQWSDCLGHLAKSLDGAKKADVKKSNPQHEDGSNIAMRERIAH